MQINSDIFFHAIFLGDCSNMVSGCIEDTLLAVLVHNHRIPYSCSLVVHPWRFLLEMVQYNLRKTSYEINTVGALHKFGSNSISVWSILFLLYLLLSRDYRPSCLRQWISHHNIYFVAGGLRYRCTRMLQWKHEINFI